MEQLTLKTKREAAKILGISCATLERLIRAGLPYIKLTSGNGGAVRFRESDLAEFIEQKRITRPAI